MYFQVSANDGWTFSHSYREDLKMQQLDTRGEINESYFEREAEAMLKKYPEYVNVFESHCQKAKAGVPLTTHDIAVFGRQLDIWEQYHNFCESNGTLGELGTMPNIALDVIAAVQTQNILPLISSSQTIDELQGTVYAKQLTVVKGANSNGTGLNGVANGAVLNDTLNGNRIHNPGFGGGRLVYTDAAPLFTTAGAAASYNVTLNANVLPGTLHLTMTDGGNVTKIMDDGEGQILSTRGVSGTINYGTGAIVLNFDTPLANGVKAVGYIDVNVEQEPNMVTVATGYKGIPITAEFFGLKTEAGLLSNFAFSKRWGRSADDEQAQDLTNELVNTMNAAGIARIVAASAGTAGTVAKWVYTPPSGVSVTEHKLSFIDTLAEAESNLSKLAGRGVVNRMLAGRAAAARLRAMPDFEPVAGGAQSQVGLYGYLGGIPVIRGVDSVIPDDDVKGLYMGTSAYDAPMVNATYLPVFVTSTLQAGENPLRNQRAVGTMVGLKVVVDRYITNMQIKPS